MNVANVLATSCSIDSRLSGKRSHSEATIAGWFCPLIRAPQTKAAVELSA